MCELLQYCCSRSHSPTNSLSINSDEVFACFPVTLSVLFSWFSGSESKSRSLAACLRTSSQDLNHHTFSLHALGLPAWSVSSRCLPSLSIASEFLCVAHLVSAAVASRRRTGPRRLGIERICHSTGSCFAFLELHARHERLSLVQVALH